MNKHILEALEGNWPEWEDFKTTKRLFHDEHGFSVGVIVGSLLPKLNTLRHDYEADAIIQKWLMGKLIEKTGPVGWKPKAVEFFAWLGIQAQKYAPDETNPTTALAMCMIAIKENE